jgi:alanyl-tRNA synthetase
MKSSEIRERYLKYFETRGHTVVPGSSLVPDEPSLLLTTAGMVQFIPYFKAERKAEHTRMASVQRCLRTTDIDKIGHTARHLTFFEMLGNFSVGDYYKKEVIPWAWEFVTKELGIDPGSLWVSVFLDDDEAFDIWNKDVGVAEDRIVRLGEDENFWSMGPTGPCGPCSEIHYDFGPDKACGPNCAVGCDCDRFLEIWNLVFMQYNRDEAGELHPLPKKNIDTGMGLERVASLLQGVKTNFETDLLRTLIDKTAALSGVSYGNSAREDISLKIVADHSRAVTFMINDGILPSNEGRGYVLRRLLRRAVRHGRQLGIGRAFVPEMADTVIELMGKAYPDVAKNGHFIKEIIKGEEDRFGETLKAGLGVLDGYLEAAETAGAEGLDGEMAFKLYDTFGFPLELTIEIAEERGLKVDQAEFNALMEQQKETARAALDGGKGRTDSPVFTAILEDGGPTEFSGYGEASAETRIRSIVSNGQEAKEAKTGEAVEVILDETPFYAEMGGQVGDIGIIETETGALEVIDTYAPAAGLTSHKGTVVKGEIKQGQSAAAKLDAERRAAIKRNHTATHIIHWALRMVLGEHVRQGGSHVDGHRLRFDFTHGAALTGDELKHIENLVNKKVLENKPVRGYTTTYKYAVDSGALAFFGEKYGKNVRVLEIGDFSRELCGGTHVARAGDIGQIRITSESSVGANLRRIEAVTGMNALELGRANEEIIKYAQTALKTAKAGIGARIDHLAAQMKEQEKEIEKLKSRLGADAASGLYENAPEIGGVKVVAGITEGKTPDEMRVLADELRNRGKAAVILAGAVNGNASIIIAFSPGLAKDGLHAGNLIREIAPMIGGGGGGRPDMAQAGGSDAGGLKKALDAAEKEITARLS